MEISKIANKARSSISSYCMNECHAMCCRKSHLPLTDKEEKYFSKHLTKEQQEERIKRSQVGFTMDLKDGCTFLREDFGCSIHKSAHKPKTCSDFPIYIKDNYVYIAPKCTAVKDGKLYPYIRRMKQEGAIIIEGTLESTSEFAEKKSINHRTKNQINEEITKKSLNNLLEKYIISKILIQVKPGSKKMTRPRVNRKLFHVFSFKKVDEDILDYYLEIQTNIEDINENFMKIYQYHAKRYLHLQGYAKEHYKIKQIYLFFARIKSQYGNCFDIAAEHNYDFSKSEKISEKIEIETVLRNLNNILESIKEETRSLLEKLEEKKVFFKNAELANLLDKLNNDLSEFSKKSEIFRDLEKEERRKIEILLERIYNRSAKERYIIKDKKSRKPIRYYCEKRIHDLRILELLPLFNHRNLEKRSQLLNELHKDATLPIFHYNVIYKKTNIHVIPFNKKNVDWLKRNAS